MSKQFKDNDIRELIVSVKNGSQDAFSVLLQRYKPLIESSVHRFSSDEAFLLHSEDLMQEASVVFYNSILAYDLEQNEVEFGLFAKVCIHNALVSQLRTLKKRSAETVNATPEKFILQEFEDPSFKVLEQERLKNIYTVIRNTLSEYEYAIWQLYISGRSSSDIADTLKTDKRSVDNAVYRIRKKLRAVLQ